MPTINYMNEVRTQELINEIKRRLALKQDVMQFTVMPTPSQALLGDTYQYIGEDTDTFKNSDFYKVVYNSEDSVYEYKQVTYNKDEINELINAAGHFLVVNELPTTDIKTNVIYLVPKVQTLPVYVDSTDDSSYYQVNASPLTYAHFDDDGEFIEEVTGTDADDVKAAIDAGTYTKEERDVKLGQYNNIKDEYINLDGTTAGWEKIGDTKLDLSEYVKFDDMIPITQGELADMWKENGTITVDSASVAVAVGADETVNVTGHTGTVSVESDDTGVATVAISGDVITITGVAAGSATVTVTSAAAGDYKAATTDIEVTVS